MFSLPVCVNEGCYINSSPKMFVKFKKVSCGARFTMAISEEGRLFSWGDAEGGVLGLGSDKISETRVPKVVEIFKSSSSSNGNSILKMCF